MDVTDIIRALGGPTKVAAAVGVKAPSIFGWMERNQIPAQRAAQIAAMLGVGPHQVRPDIFPAPAGAPAPRATEAA